MHQNSQFIKAFTKQQKSNEILAMVYKRVLQKITTNLVDLQNFDLACKLINIFIKVK